MNCLKITLMEDTTTCGSHYENGRILVPRGDGRYSNFQIVRPHLGVRQPDGTQMKKGGVGVRWGAFQPEMTRGWGPFGLVAQAHC